MVLVSGEAVRALVDSAGPDAAFLPGVVEDVATRTGATVLARVALLRYSGSTVRLADHYEVNAGLYKDQVTHQLTARVALCDPSGAVRWIDEIHAIQSRTEMYWGDEAPGGRKVLQTRWVPYVGETEEWEDPSLHAGESTAEAIERGVRKASEAERDRARIRNEVLRSAGVLPPEL